MAAGFFDFEPHVDAVELSLMCPNVLAPGEVFDELNVLAEVLARIEGRAKPVIVRVPNDTTLIPDRFAESIERSIEARVEGLKVGGGRRIPEPGLGTGAATLHGRAIREAALANVTAAARIARDIHRDLLETLGPSALSDANSRATNIDSAQGRWASSHPRTPRKIRFVQDPDPREM